jgi:hypothetical protein
MELRSQIQQLARECARKKPLNESIWLLANKDGDLRVHITDPSVREIRGIEGYCMVAIARNMSKPTAQDIICEWGRYISGEQLSIDRALNMVEHEAKLMVNMMAR